MDGTNAVFLAGRSWRIRSERPAADPAHLIALREGVYRVPDQVSMLRVLVGRAWVSLGSIDYVLAQGEELAIPAGTGRAVASALGAQTLILETETGRKF